MTTSLSSQDAFVRIYKEHANAIYRFCLVRVSNKEQALDIMQETFLRLWRSLLEGKVMSNYRSFLFTIAHNLIIDWYRKKKNLSLESVMAQDAASDHGFIKSIDIAIEEDVGLKAEARHLVAKIAELKPTYRQVIYLRFVEGLSPQDIGTIIGTTANTASVRIARGLEELRKITGYDHQAE